MGNQRRSQPKPQDAAKVDREGLSPDRSSALEENVQAIKRWESAILLARTKPEQVSDLMKKTDLRRLTNRMEELAEPATSAASQKSIDAGSES